jgi:general stress protein 26
MKKPELVQFLQGHRWAVEATVAEDGAPQAAVIGVAVTDDLEIVFDTSTRSRKAENLRRTKRAALVVGWDQGQTVQLEGPADEIARGSAEHARLLAAYVGAFPDGVERAKDADITYFRVRPTWARYSDFRGGTAVIEETRYEVGA